MEDSWGGLGLGGVEGTSAVSSSSVWGASGAVSVEAERLGELSCYGAGLDRALCTDERRVWGLGEGGGREAIEEIVRRRTKALL